MNVIQIIGLGAKKFGGLERYDLELARQLHSRGDKLILIFDDYPKTNEYLTHLSELNVEWYVVPFENKFSYVRSLFLIFSKYKPLFVQTNFNNLLSVLVVSLLCRSFSINGFFTTEHCFPDLNNFKTRLVYWCILKLCDHMFCVSEKSRESILNKLKGFENHVSTLYLGVEDFLYDKQISRLKYNLPKDKLIIGNVAYHNSIKGVDVLIDSVTLLKTKYKLNNFLVCQIGGGSASDTMFLHDRVAKNGISECFIWMGIQNNVPELLSAFDIYCQSSRSEGVPLSIMEASFAGIPIVATNVGGVSEAAIEGENAILVSPNNPNLLAAELYNLLSNEDICLRMGKTARKIAYNKFSLKKQVADLIAFYDEYK